MITSSADLPGYFGCSSTGMPRPLSKTVRRLPRLERDLDAAGVAGDRLVHRIVDDLGGEMVERAGVGPADVHARPAADRLEPLEHLDRGRVVAVWRGRGGRREQIGHFGLAIGRGFSACQGRGPVLSTALEIARRSRARAQLFSRDGMREPSSRLETHGREMLETARCDDQAIQARRVEDEAQGGCGHRLASCLGRLP